MSAASLDIIVEQGTTFKREVTLSDGMTPLDLSSWTLRGQIRKKYSDTDIVASFTFEKNTPSTDGVFRFILSDTITSSIQVDPASSVSKKTTKYVYDIEADTGSEIIRLLEGICSVSPEVTR
jgi:hypothetical protein